MDQAFEPAPLKPPSSFSHASVGEGARRADEGRRAARAADGTLQSAPNLPPRLAAQALIRRCRATFSRQREKDARR
jgi:hypothetical protein